MNSGGNNLGVGNKINNTSNAYEVYDNFKNVAKLSGSSIQKPIENLNNDERIILDKALDIIGNKGSQKTLSKAEVKVIKAKLSQANVATKTLDSLAKVSHFFKSIHDSEFIESKKLIDKFQKTGKTLENIQNKKDLEQNKIDSESLNKNNALLSDLVRHGGLIESVLSDPAKKSDFRFKQLDETDSGIDYWISINERPKDGDLGKYSFTLNLLGEPGTQTQTMSFELTIGKGEFKANLENSKTADKDLALFRKFNEGWNVTRRFKKI